MNYRSPIYGGGKTGASPIANGRGKLSRQAAVGYGNFVDEASRHRRPRRPAKTKTLRSHRLGR